MTRSVGSRAEASGMTEVRPHFICLSRPHLLSSSSRWYCRAQIGGQGSARPEICTAEAGAGLHCQQEEWSLNPRCAGGIKPVLS